MPAFDTDRDTRLKFLHIDAATAAHLREAWPIVRPGVRPALDAFYAHLQTFPELAKMFSGPEQIERLKQGQENHWANLFKGSFDDRITSYNVCYTKLLRLRTGVYWHMLPTATQARKAVWDAVDGEGRRVLDQVFPRPLRAATSATEMKIALKCGSLWQLVGSDNFNALVGANPVGVVFSEYSLADPAAWDYVRPILAENGGWAVFIFTPRNNFV